ncbi:LacI family DNA-binding transcriptional regulator [Aureimonas populi]|uniref:LacI family DNA-binding transcriptional regulator n=1 Tax=Aureimonas populi TaxID=1701758 RepID=A0ABW5CKE5_9HYPH|nr:LacI family DNA-binding transcriptional regulator [Aureimonas populi]
MQNPPSPSLASIARHLGVSTATVSNALRGVGRVSPELAERIRRVAAEVRYVPDQVARALRTGRSTTIGLVVPDFGLPLFPDFAQAVERAAKRRGYGVLIADSLGTAEGQAAEIANLAARGVDALVVIPVRGSRVGIDEHGVPVALIDSATTLGNTASSDHRDAGRQLMGHLLALGHRDILIFGGPQNSAVAVERVAGMRERLDEAGIAAEIRHGPPSFEAGVQAARELDAGSATALACAYDAIAVGLVNGLAQRGIAIPRDISIAGIDGIAWATIVSPSLTSVRQDLAAIAEHAIAFVAGETAEPRLLPVELIVRASTASPSPRPAPTGVPA